MAQHSTQTFDSTVGNRYDGPVYRDGIHVLLSDETNGDALAPAGFLTAAAVNTLLTASRAWYSGATTLTADSIPGGVIEMGAGDGVELYFLGAGGAAENEAFNYLVTAIHPVFDPNATDPTAPIAYLETLLSEGLATAGATTAGAAGATINGVATGDLWCDTLTATSLTGVEAFSPTGDGIAYLTVTAEGAAIVRVQTDLTTADGATVLGRRIQGAAQNRG